MNRWWITRKYGLPPWLLDGRAHPDADRPGLPVAWESPGGQGGGEGGGGSSGGSGGSGEGSGEGGSGSGGSGGGDDDLTKANARIATLQQELRTTKQTAARVTQLESQLAALNDKDKTDLDKANERIVALERSITDAKAGRERALIRAAVERKAAELSFIDVDVAFALMDRSGLTVTDEDTVEGVDIALQALLTAKPHLKKTEGSGEGEGGNGQAGSGKAPGPTPRRNTDTGQRQENPVNTYMDRAYGAKPPERLTGSRR